MDEDRSEDAPRGIGEFGDSMDTGATRPLNQRDKLEPMLCFISYSAIVMLRETESALITIIIRLAVLCER